METGDVFAPVPSWILTGDFNVEDHETVGTTRLSLAAAGTKHELNSISSYGVLWLKYVHLINWKHALHSAAHSSIKRADNLPTSHCFSEMMTLSLQCIVPSCGQPAYGQRSCTEPKDGRLSIKA